MSDDNEYLTERGEVEELDVFPFVLFGIHRDRKDSTNGALMKTVPEVI